MDRKTRNYRKCHQLVLFCCFGAFPLGLFFLHYPPNSFPFSLTSESPLHLELCCPFFELALASADSCQEVDSSAPAPHFLLSGLIPPPQREALNPRDQGSESLRWGEVVGRLHPAHALVTQMLYKFLSEVSRIPLVFLTRSLLKNGIKVKLP